MRSSTVGARSNVSDDGDDGDVESGAGEGGRVIGEGADVKPVIFAKSRLSRSAPFARVFAIWPEGKFEGGQSASVGPAHNFAGALFPATIIKILKTGLVKIVFDDGSQAPDFEWAKLRKCQLKRGDLVYYRGEEEMTDTQAEALASGSEVAVYETEVAEAGGEVVLDGRRDEMGRRDLVIVTTADVAPDDQAQARQHKLELSAICIRPSRLSQLDDRRFTQTDIMRMQARTSHKITNEPIEKLDLLAVPPVAALKPAKPMRRPDGLFSRIGFLTTFVDAIEALDATGKRRKATGKAADVRRSELKEDFHKLIEQHGGVRVDIGHLYTLEDKGLEGEVQTVFDTASLGGPEQVVLVADRHSTTPKYLVALALGLPIVSHRWVEACVQQHHTLDWRPYALGAGDIADLGIVGPGSQGPVLGRQAFSLAAVADEHARAALFARDAFLVVLPERGAKGKLRRAEEEERAKQVLTLRTIVGAAGAGRVDFVEGVGRAGRARGYDYVLLEVAGGEVGGGLEGHGGVASMEWLKECLKAGRKVAIVGAK